jgi:hypothetical protein
MGSPAPPDLDFYDLFLMKVERLCADHPREEEELANVLDVNKAQLKVWLGRAVAEEKLSRSKRPARYEWRGAEKQMGMFRD